MSKTGEVKESKKDHRDVRNQCLFGEKNAAKNCLQFSKTDKRLPLSPFCPHNFKRLIDGA
jgi:hypothetical protein